ncbi:Rieske (2Fe-2S) protein [Vogesella facilis]|uniref:Rieske (2Fe-2S) protein n=1 Tax=Vogesella facilis TaxID=1655232 RepID=A0ABV7RA54_9NEIS
MPENARRIWLCRRDDIADGVARGFDPFDRGQDALFVLSHGGQVYGYRNACPHVDGAPMAWRRDGYLNSSGTRIVCYAHGAQFLPESGRCVQGPCLGQYLQPVPLEVDGGGELYAWLTNRE